MRRLHSADTAVVLAAPHLFSETPRQEWVQDLLDNPATMLWWATNDNGQALGYLLATELSLPGEAELFVYDMGIGAEALNRFGADVCAALLDRACDFAADSGWVRLWGVPRPGATLYDANGAATTRIYIDVD